MTLLVLAVKCPSCGKRPAVRISESEREQKMSVADDETVMSYECRRCRVVFVVTAKAYKGAAAYKGRST